MIKVLVKKQSNYPVSTPKLKKRIRDFFEKHGIVSDATVSVALVGEKYMLDIAKKYLKDGRVHNVLSFPADEAKDLPAGRQGKFIHPPGDIIDLGEIVVCYPKAFEEAKAEGKRIEEKVHELAEHGALHLLGIHHS
jgi:probable rRNA maturation factor